MILILLFEIIFVKIKISSIIYEVRLPSLRIFINKVNFKYFFLFGYIKNWVYIEKLDGLKQRIRKEVAWQISQQMLRNTMSFSERCFDEYLLRKGLCLADMIYENQNKNYHLFYLL